MNWLAWTRRGFLVGGVLLTAGCLSPTLPLPPPSAPRVTSPDAAGFVFVSGHVRPEAVAYAKNVRTGRIAGQETDETGEYELELTADVGDRLVVWYEVDMEPSQTTEVLVPDEDPSDSLGGASSLGGSSN